MITDEDKAWVVHLACSKPKEFGYAAEVWTRKALAKHVREHAGEAGHPALSRAVKATVQRILAAQPLHPEKVKYYLERRDPDFEAKMREILLVYREVALQNQSNGGLAPVIVTVSVDEKPGLQAIAKTAPDLPPVPGKYATTARDHEYKRPYMSSPGKLLQQERLTRNRTLSDIANETCIGSRYLEAIEEDNRKALPGDFFYRSFIKQYAQALHLDRETIDAILGAAAPSEEVDPLPALTMAYKTARTEGRLSGLYRPRTGVAVALLTLVLIGCTGLYAIWSSAQVDSEIRSTEPAAVPPQPDTKPPEPAPAPAVPKPAEAAKIQVDLAAREKTWVSLSSEGRTIFKGVLRRAQTKNFAVSEQAKLMTRNAAGLDVRWNGKPIGPIGLRGQMRVVLLKADNFEILPPRRM